MEPEVILVKPWGKDQGDHVRINKADFDPDFHELLDESKKSGTDGDDEKIAAIKAELDAAGVKYHHKLGLTKLQELLDESKKQAQ